MCCWVHDANSITDNVWGWREGTATHAPTSLCLLLFTLLTHARSDHVSNINEETHPPPTCVVHPHLFGWATGGTRSKPKKWIEAGQKKQRSVTSHTAQWWDMITAEGQAECQSSWGRGDSLRGNAECAPHSSCPRVYWSAIALRGGGRSPVPFITTSQLSMEMVSCQATLCACCK